MARGRGTYADLPCATQGARSGTTLFIADGWNDGVQLQASPSASARICGVDVVGGRPGQFVDVRTTGECLGQQRRQRGGLP
jgi:hypothetical protein